VVNCDYCDTPLSDERADIYSHCPADNCVVMWKRMRLEDFSLTLVPKQGFHIIYKTDNFLKVGGRSSGKVT
jgi:hypothetical protein